MTWIKQKQCPVNSKRTRKKNTQNQSKMADEAPREDDYPSSEDEWAAPLKPLEATPATADANKVELAQLDADERELAQDVAPIFFTVPANGENFRMSFAMGQTVGYLKGKLEDVKGWPYERIILTLLLRDGETDVRKKLIDPLSLNDLPFVAQQDNVVEVTFTEA